MLEKKYSVYFDNKTVGARSIPNLSTTLKEVSPESYYVVNKQLDQNLCGVQGVQCNFLSVANSINNVRSTEPVELYTEYGIRTIVFPDSFYGYSHYVQLGTDIQTLIRLALTDLGVPNPEHFTVTTTNSGYTTMQWAGTTTYLRFELSAHTVFYVLGYSNLIYTLNEVHTTPSTIKSEATYDPYRNLRTVWVYANFAGGNSNWHFSKDIEDPWMIFPLNYTENETVTTTLSGAALDGLYKTYFPVQKSISAIELRFYSYTGEDENPFIPFPFSSNEISGCITFLWD